MLEENRSLSEYLRYRISEDSERFFELWELREFVRGYLEIRPYKIKVAKHHLPADNAVFNTFRLSSPKVIILNHLFLSVFISK